MMHSEPLLQAQGISKFFFGVSALDDVDFELPPARSTRCWARTARGSPPSSRC